MEEGPPLKEYTEEQGIGIGSFGMVSSYKLKGRLRILGGKRRDLPKWMAVKRIIFAEENESRTLRELAVMQKLRHENIINVLGATHKQRYLYIKMELANTDLLRLKQFLKVERFPERQVIIFGQQIIRGLRYMHENSISHRDLKPENILVFCKEGGDSTPLSIYSFTLKLTDFGLSRFVPNESASATAVGTRQYMAPEVARAFHRQEKFHGDYMQADVFSAGVVLYELLHGKRPFAGADLTNVEEAILPDLDNTDIKRLSAFLNRMLKWTSKDRSTSHQLNMHWCEINYGFVDYPTLVKEEEAFWRQLAALDEAVANEQVKLLIELGDDINRADITGWTPLHKACQENAVSVVKALIKNGAKINIANSDGKKPLHLVCKAGSVTLVELLIERGKAEINHADCDGLTPLHIACSLSHVMIAQMLLEKGADLTKQEKSKGWTPMHFTCHNRHQPLAQVLIKEGAKVNQVDHDGLTPLLIACFAGHFQLAELLLMSGADVNQADHNGLTSLHIACKNGDFELAELLLLKGADKTAKDTNGLIPIDHALKASCHFRSEIEIKSSDLIEWTLLQKACQMNTFSVVKTLVDLGVDVNKTDFNGRTPLHLTCKTGNIPLVEILFEEEATNINHADYNGITPLHIACSLSHVLLAHMLLEKGADANKPENSKGLTPLHFACQNRHRPLAQALVNEGANVNQADYDGLTPLHMACDAGHFELAELLLQNGADKNAKNKSGRIPLEGVNMMRLEFEDIFEMSYEGASTA